MSGGRLAYSILPDTANGGYTEFNRYFFAQVGKEGAVIDERFNGGGDVADDITEIPQPPADEFVAQTRRRRLHHAAESDLWAKGHDHQRICGLGRRRPAMVLQRAAVGKLIGKRTWGGLVGIFNFPSIDGWRFCDGAEPGIYNLTGEWDVENHGVPPDIEVEYDPAAVRAGHDPQLEKAVAVVLADLEKHPIPVHKKPAYPSYRNHKDAGSVTDGSR